MKKAPLTLRAENKSRTYGAENPAFTLAYEGLVYDDTAADLASPTVTCEATATSVPAGYPSSWNLLATTAMKLPL